jgi:antibiotic biosynthesis monooxygenase (ABM) superfamily enzyme
MKCPHCDNKVSFFSKAMNKFGKVKVCPHCGQNVRFKFNLKTMALLFIPTVLFSFLLRPYLGGLSSVAPLFLMFLVSAKLDPINA